MVDQASTRPPLLLPIPAPYTVTMVSSSYGMSPGWRAASAALDPAQAVGPNAVRLLAGTAADGSDRPRGSGRGTVGPVGGRALCGDARRTGRPGDRPCPGAVAHVGGERPMSPPKTSGGPGQWVLLSYRLPREPSTPRIGVWRKLERLGVTRLGDGLVAL